ncbi:MAG: two-component regulator propeller domain-containing protein, partial [Candidatus Aminicenantales bacterium]
MKTIRIALGTALFLAAAAIAAAQSYQVRTYTEADGLCSSVVQDIAQDAQGQIWFATRSGISVFDGSTWTSYVRPRDIPSANVFKLTIDRNGTVWAWADNPEEFLLKFAAGRWTSIPRPAFASRPIRPTALAAFGPPGGETVLLGTRDHGLLAWEAGKWSALDSGNGLPTNSVCGIAVAGPRRFIATPKGLTILESGAPRLDGPAPAEWKLGVFGIVGSETAQGMLLWLAGRNWVGTYSREGFQVLSRNLLLHVDETYPHVALTSDGRGGVYVGNPYGIFHIPPGGGGAEKIGKDSGLIDNGATDFLLDREKNLWIVGLRGANKITSRRFANFRQLQGLLDDEVTAMARWNGGLVFGHNRGLTFFDGLAFRTLPFSAPRPDLDITTRVLDLAVDKRGCLWAAATWGGLLRITPGGGRRWFGAAAGFNGAASCVAAAPDGTVWAALNDRLFRMSGDRAVPVFPRPGGNDYIRKIFFGPNGELMLASSRGLWVQEKDVWTRYHDPASREISDVFAVLRDDAGRVLVGTMSGLMELKAGRLTPFTPAGLKIERPVFLILR